MIARTVFVVALGLVALAVLRTALQRSIRLALAPPRTAHGRSPAAYALPFETVRIATAAGRTLHGWLIPPAASCSEPYPAVIVMHGWGSNAALMLPLAQPLHAAGFAALFIDARCHGASDGDTFASLPRFAEDVEHAFDWLAARPDMDARRIALLGHSVGAGAVLLVAARRPEVAAVVSVAAFSHPAVMMRRWLTARHIPERPLGRYILDYVQRTIGHRFDDIAPQRTIAHVRCPVLLVHGADDAVVPVSEARAILAARAHDAVTLLVLSGDHESFADAERHVDRLTAFLQHALVPPARGATRDTTAPAGGVRSAT
jgi:dipeptidyl aminopeptidase/acylaminoacyl peptidase